MDPRRPARGADPSWIHLRLWQPPEQSAGEFSFPLTSSRQKGAVIYFPGLASPRAIRWQSQPRQNLSGRVRFVRINGREAVEGELDFLTDRKVRLRGTFVARWVPGSPRCG
ncbi:MAG: hypothetical protein ER33_08180 [Cyanobium sp. CACIAM 14]|nr:MAG: hypothetical protein ER33_08180 [Cyanobium sp. CACIAM 14]